MSILWLETVFECFTTCFFFQQKKFLYYLAPPLSLWNSFLELSERLYPQLWYSGSHQIKHNSQLLGGAFFFFFSHQFWQPQRDTEQISLFHLNSLRNQSFGTSRGPLVPAHLLGESKLIWVSFSWALDLLLPAGYPKFYSILLNFLLDE